jgi:acyl carrier protein
MQGIHATVPDFWELPHGRDRLTAARILWSSRKERPMARQVSQRIEVLLKKASVDPEFKTAFLERRGEIAQEIGLSLEPAEAAMLRAVRREQLEAIIASTSVPDEHRRAFLGQAAAAMLAALGIVAGRPGAAAGQVPEPPFFGGVRPDNPQRTDPNADLPPGGIRPDMPEKKPKTLQQRVISVIAKQLKIDEEKITSNKKGLEDLSLVDDLGATASGLAQLRKALVKEFTLKIPSAAFKKLHTVGETVDYVKKEVDKRKSAAQLKKEAPSQSPDQPPPPDAPVVPPGFPPVAGGVRPK